MKGGWVRRFAWLLPVLVFALLVLPAVIGERYTSPTQDGQYVLYPFRGWSFVLTLLTADDAALSSSGEALKEARAIFRSSPYRPVKVELLYLDDTRPYVYVRRSGAALSIDAPPRLVWEVWGRSRDVTGAAEAPDVIGFLGYESGLSQGSGAP